MAKAKKLKDPWRYPKPKRRWGQGRIVMTAAEMKAEIRAAQQTRRRGR
jgi:hypothetical protein